jgi:anti-sigma regulatory factor (Ser/Thr protein kinase)
MARQATVRATDTHTRTDHESAVTGHGLQAISRGGGYGSGGRTTGGPGMTVELEPGATAAGEARAALSVLDGRVDAGALDDVRLLVSELVTNSVRHAGAERELVRLAVTTRGRTMRVEVSDGGNGFEPRERTAPKDQEGGWGLHLVDRLADRWGVQTGRRARVWFEIDS